MIQNRKKEVQANSILFENRGLVPAGGGIGRVFDTIASSRWKKGDKMKEAFFRFEQTSKDYTRAAAHLEYILREGKFQNKHDLICKGALGIPQFIDSDTDNTEIDRAKKYVALKCKHDKESAAYRIAQNIEAVRKDFICDSLIINLPDCFSHKAIDLAGKCILNLVESGVYVGHDPHQKHDFIDDIGGDEPKIQNKHLHIQQYMKADDGIPREENAVFRKYNPHAYEKNPASCLKSTAASRFNTWKMRVEICKILNGISKEFGYEVFFHPESFYSRGCEQDRETLAKKYAEYGLDIFDNPDLLYRMNAGRGSAILSQKITRKINEKKELTKWEKAQKDLYDHNKEKIPKIWADMIIQSYNRLTPEEQTTYWKKLNSDVHNGMAKIYDLKHERRQFSKGSEEYRKLTVDITSARAIFDQKNEEKKIVAEHRLELGQQIEKERDQSSILQKQPISERLTEKSDKICFRQEIPERVSESFVIHIDLEMADKAIDEAGRQALLATIAGQLEQAIKLQESAGITPDPQLTAQLAKVLGISVEWEKEKGVER